MATARHRAYAQQSGRGRQADDPREIPAKGWKDIAWRLWQEINEDRVMLVAAGVTYYLLLALVPTLTAFVSIYGLFTDPATVTQHVQMLAGVVPAGGMEIIQEQLARLTSEGGGTLGITLLVSLAIALWSSSSGVKALFEAMNVAYDETEKRNFFVLNAMALAFTLAGVVAILVLIGVVVVLPGILAALNLGTGFEWLVRILSYVAMVAVLLVGIAALYRWGPSREEAKWRWITPGAVLAVVGIVVVSVLFSWYVSNFGNYNATYGSLGALIGLLTWLWLTVTVLIVGGELNSEIEHQTAQDSTTGPDRPLGQRGAEMADKVGAPVGGNSGSSEVEPADRGEGARQRQPFSVGQLTVALPAALLINWMQKRQRQSR